MTGRRMTSAALALLTTMAAMATVANASATSNLPAASGVVLTAHADPLTDAETQARQLQAEVSKLQLEVEQASERYDGAQASLVRLVITQEQATRAATAATRPSTRRVPSLTRRHVRCTCPVASLVSMPAC